MHHTLQIAPGVEVFQEQGQQQKSIVDQAKALAQGEKACVLAAWSNHVKTALPCG